MIRLVLFGKLLLYVVYLAVMALAEMQNFVPQPSGKVGLIAALGGFVGGTIAIFAFFDAVCCCINLIAPNGRWITDRYWSLWTAAPFNLGVIGFWIVTFIKAYYDVQNGVPLPESQLEFEIGSKIGAVILLYTPFSYVANIVAYLSTYSAHFQNMQQQQNF